MTVADLRQRYPKFVYREFRSQVTEGGLELTFLYEAPGDDPTSELKFTHRVSIPGISQEQIDTLSPERFSSYVFHLGLFELFNYWKATCSPEIRIEAGALNHEQIAWWHQLLLKGMGEYFYVNQIDFTPADFVRIVARDEEAIVPQLEHLELPSHLPSLLVALGGGKDSVVTTQLLLEHSTSALQSFLVNPTQAARDIAAATKLEPAIIVTRELDPILLELNEQGYLNGHVPFSAVVAWESIFTAELLGVSGVAVSNERSSNEGNALYQGVEINHQYSKTFEFERSLQVYCQTYFPDAPHYFSFLRPLYELQIARIFAAVTENEPAHTLRSLFRSCNRGQRTNSWCGICSKCLFAYTILSPFIAQSELETMFGKNMLADTELWPVVLELVGKGENKPFECVGTYEESLLAFYLSKQRLVADGQHLPALLEQVDQRLLATEINLDERAQTLLASWNQEHSIPTDLADLLTSAVS